MQLTGRDVTVRRSRAALALVVVACAALAGCVVTPPAAPPAPGVTSQPPATPAASTPPVDDPAPSPSASDPGPTDVPDAGQPGDPTSLTIDGLPSGAWVQSIFCSLFTPTSIQLGSDSDQSESGLLVGSVLQEDGSWVAVGILLGEAGSTYFQAQERVPAVVEEGRLTIEFEASSMSAELVDVVLSIDCD